MEAGLFALGVAAGARLLAGGRVKRGLRYLVEPVPYWRSLEFRLTWQQGEFSSRDTVLDIGSPKLFSLYLASKIGARVHATDIDDYFVDEYRTLRRDFGVPAERMAIEVEDGRALNYRDAQFSRVYSVSVIEHIPESGDSECAREIGRVLEPGGIALITVPFWPTSKDVFRRADAFYWAGSSVAASDGSGTVFFQRRYSEHDLRTRLIEPSGLEVEERLFVGERLLKNSEHEFSEVLPRIGTGPFQPLLSRLVHTSPTRDWQQLAKPLCAFLKLRKR
jgi:SAM-dependent methyltransferase